MIDIRSLLRAAGLCLLCVSLFACGKGETAADTTTMAEETTAEIVTEAPAPETVRIAARGEKSEFQIVYSTEDDTSGKYAARILNTLKDRLGVTVMSRADYLAKQETPCEILVGATRREDCAALTETLKNNEYAIKTVAEDGKTKVIIAYKGVYALMCAVDRFMQEYIHEDKGIAEVPADLEVRGNCAERDALIVSSIPQLRDPCVLVEDGVYEDGTPEEIFDNPKREKTIRFIKHLKVFETVITSKDFDFIGFNTSLEEFGRKNQVAQRAIMRAQAVFEELGVQIILPELSGEFQLSVALEYSQDEETLSMLIKYDGKRFDVRESDNMLSLKLAENASQSIEYTEISEDGFTNLVTVKIK